ncbi:DUF3822 family protein [Gelatiniphilus marinus]|uniref:DUF3822 family protein n=1 Tax=Gelatiniphilus marinus TaxID=1759464 RepID=A0ABW5JPW2_9FLAO
MALTNKDYNKPSYKELSIQISLSGLSFCILNRDTQTISTLKQIDFNKKLNPFEVLDKLIQLFNTENALQDTFSNVIAIHTNELSTLVPEAFFDEACLAHYLKFNSKILKTDFIAFDTIKTNNSVNVYVPYININNFIYEKFGSFTYKHFSTILIERILAIEKNADGTKVYVNVNTVHFEIIVTKKGKLTLYNTFEYSTKEDFIYYILFTAEQLKLNPETLHLILIGNISKDDELYNIAYTYIRHVSFGKRLDNYKYLQPTDANHSNFTLIHSF